MRKVLLFLLFNCFCLLGWAQIKQVSGTVTSKEDGSPVPGANVLVKGTSNGAQTDGNGKFSIKVDASATLVFQAVGFAGQEIKVAGREVINVSLLADQKQLQEVVVVGYGTQLKRDLTGSIGKVTSKEFKEQPLSSFESALQGRTTGVYINSGSGKLGQGVNIRVRGISSISASNQPLFVIDGIPVVSEDLGSQGEPMNPMADINPDDIESIEVLKDAASAAIYGSRASNGVIMVSTKKGKVGKTKVSFSASGGVSDATHLRQFLNPAQYRELFTAAAENMGYDIAEEFEAESRSDDWNKSFETDWNNSAFQKGAVQQYSASVTGGDAKTTFFVSSTLNDQKGVILGNNFKRMSGRLNLDHGISKSVKIGTSINLVKSINDRISADNEFANPVQLNAIPPIQPMYDAGGEYNNATLYYNNLINLDNAFNTQTNFRTLGNAYLSWNLIPELTFRSEFGLDYLNLEESVWNGRKTLDGGPQGFSSDNQVRSSNWVFKNNLTWDKTLNQFHNLQVLAGFDYQESTLLGTSVSGKNFASDTFKKIQNAAVISAGSTTETGYSFVSYILRGNYKFKDRYLFGATLRVDGSSRFGKDNRYGAFPSISAGWLASEENFLANNSTISFLKLRASYGVTGNSEIGNFASHSLYNSVFYADQAGITPATLGAPDLSWERTAQGNIGVDYGLFNNRISGEIDVYQKRTNDLLLFLPTQASNGFTGITKNIGDLTNRGIEFSINTQNLIHEFKWSTSFNISFNRNKVTNMNGAVITGGSRTLSRIEEGQPYGIFYGKKYAGVDPENGDALYMNKDGSKTNDYDAADEMILGDPNPAFSGGLGNKFSYHNFDLDIQTQFVSGNDLYNIAGFFQSVNGDYFDNQTVDQMNYWKSPGQITNIPQPRLYEGNGAGKSSRWVEDGSYLRFKAVTLGYNIPLATTKRLGIDNLRVYLSAQNLFTFTNYTGYDPEVNASYTGNVNLGHDFYTPPQSRTIILGVNVGF
ncbi:SusC/RagA family TonB-linked outer membrane protein [Solitalea longa]|uniref:SusC/RagA family TonB-linked outer membrane protein n=1 Tax=Solitalea longa TaxID=2079460 RepID=A0A2S5A3H0_9SPHI|nr:TonB-dependent receptor [Solitalea longa]POY37064.1 SusC/RagA family TonB-linked outer membrane protein [Solitalea longa]